MRDATGEMDAGLLARVALTNRRLLDVVNLIPIANWGLDEDVQEKLRQRKHRIVNQKLSKAEKKSMSKASKQRMARGLGGVCDTVGAVLEWMKESTVAKQLQPTKKKTREDIKKEKAELMTSIAEKKKQQKRVEEAGKKKKSEEKRKDEPKTPKEVSQKNHRNDVKEQAVGEEEAEPKVNPDAFIQQPVDTQESSGEEEEAASNTPITHGISASSEASISGEAKSKKRRRKEASGEDEKLPLKEIAKRIKLEPIDFSKLDPIEGRKVAMERLQRKIEMMKASRRGKKTPAQFEEERKAKRRLSKLSMKQRKADGKKKEKEPLKAEDKEKALLENTVSRPKETEETPIVYSKFDYILREEERKLSKKEKRDKFTGKDYTRLLEKAEKRAERLEKIRDKNPDKAESIEEKIKWNKAQLMAEGGKVKDNIELLKRGVKKKEKLKEKRKHKWQERTKRIDEEKSKKQGKRDTNIQKRREIKEKKHKERLRKKGRLI